MPRSKIEIEAVSNCLESLLNMATDEEDYIIVRFKKDNPPCLTLILADTHKGTINGILSEIDKDSTVLGIFG